MVPTTEELQLGAKAYERVRVYEKYAECNRRQLPWIFLICALVLVVVNLAFKTSTRHLNFGIFFALIPAGFCWSVAQDRLAKKRYANDKLMLQLLAEKYGDALPWVIEQKELASAQKLEAEMAEARLAGMTH